MEGDFDFCASKTSVKGQNSYLLSPRLPSPFAPGLWLGPESHRNLKTDCGSFSSDPWWGRCSVSLCTGCFKPVLQLPRAQAFSKGRR